MKKAVLLTVLITVIVMFALIFFAFFMVNGYIFHIGDSAIIKEIYKQMQIISFVNGYYTLEFVIISYIQCLLKTIFVLIGSALVLLFCGVGVFGLIRKRKNQ